MQLFFLFCLLQKIIKHPFLDDEFFLIDFWNAKLTTELQVAFIIEFKFYLHV